MAFSFEQLQKATKEEFISNPELRTAFTNVYGGGSANPEQLLGLYQSNQRNFEADKAYVLGRLNESISQQTRGNIDAFGNFNDPTKPVDFAESQRRRQLAVQDLTQTAQKLQGYGIDPNTLPTYAESVRRLGGLGATSIGGDTSQMDVANRLAQAQALASGGVPGGKPVSITAQSLTPAQPIQLPPATATDTNATLVSSVATELNTARKTLETAYQKQLDDLKAKEAAAQKRIDELNAAVEGTITDDINRLSAPFRETLEKAERERLKIEENFFENQKLTNELEALLTDGNNLIQQMRGVTGLGGIRNPRINQAIEGVNARVGVISAVMAARNGQIAQAGNLIDRSVQAITSDRQDQLGFYSTLVNYYSTLKDEEGKKIVNLTKDQKEVINNQVALLQGDVARIQQNADALKIALTNPVTALAYAKAGVTLTDSPEQVAAKLARQSLVDDVTTKSNALTDDGYQPITKEQITSKGSGANIASFIDNQGNTHYFWKPEPPSAFKVVGGQLVNTTTGTVVGGADAGPSKYSVERAARTVQSVDELLTKVDTNPEIFGRSAAFPLHPALRSDAFRNFESELNTLKANIAFNELTAMREASKTGGALGQVSNIELALLESALGALKMSQSPANFKAQLQKIRDSIGRWQKAAGAATTTPSTIQTNPPRMILNNKTYILQPDGTYLPQ